MVLLIFGNLMRGLLKVLFSGATKYAECQSTNIKEHRGMIFFIWQV